MAFILTVSAIAQSTDNNTANKKWRKRDFGQKQFKNGANLDSLHLSDDQKRQIKPINESFRQQMKDLNKQGSITVDEQKQKREALIKEHKEKVSAILTPSQREQVANYTKDFKKGRQSRGGGDRFSKLTKDLNLTTEQSAKVASINTTFRTNLKNLRINTSLTENEKKEQMKSRMKQHKSDMEAVLTNDQKEQLKSLQKNRTNGTFVK